MNNLGLIARSLQMQNKTPIAMAVMGVLFC